MITLFSSVYAQSVENPVLDNIRDMSPTQYFSGVIPTFFALIVVVGIIIFLFFFLLGTVDWITSGGDKMRIERARNRITTSLIGLIILLSFIAIVSIVENFFGIGFRTVVVGPYNIRLLPPPTQVPRPSGCGNRIIESNEVCDDGNTESGDGCRGDCLRSCIDSDGNDPYVAGFVTICSFVGTPPILTCGDMNDNCSLYYPDRVVEFVCNENDDGLPLLIQCSSYSCIGYPGYCEP